MPRCEATPVACTLTPGDLNSRLAWIAELTRDALRQHRRYDLVLQLTYAPEAAHRVREMVRKEQACCPFLTFDLREEPDAVRLMITAPEDARGAADTLFEQFVAGDADHGAQQLSVAGGRAIQPTFSNRAASPKAEVGQLEQRLTSVLRPGVLFPDWTVLASALARATLVAMLEAVWDQRAWQDHTPAEDAVRRAVLECFRERGHAPSPEEIARRSGTAPEKVRALLQRLAGRDLVVLEGDRVLGAYPLSERPTGHRVRIGKHVLHAMCAIDALGVGAMYRTNSVIEARCRLCRATIDITTGDDGRRLDAVLPVDAVVFAGIGYRGGCAATSLCTTIAFFCGAAHLSAWRASQRLEGPGYRLSIDEAFQVGKAIFGPVLAPPPGPEDQPGLNP
ncbi:MAG: organomercurial lyase [Geminicoccaceae bacterium]